jgi:signal peptidase II
LKKNIIYFIVAILILDQFLKFYIKLNFAPGEEHAVLGEWFKLHFVENPGMAWGWKFGGETGKVILTLFRLGAVVWGTFLIKGFIEKQYHKSFIYAASLIYAGALGNLIDSMFYGLIFDTTYNDLNSHNAGVVANFLSGHGYGTFLHGKVVDMLYFPIIDTNLPSWFPIWSGENFKFFSPVFNIADASISIGVGIIIVFQSKFFKNSVVQEANSSSQNNFSNENL